MRLLLDTCVKAASRLNAPLRKAFASRLNGGGHTCYLTSSFKLSEWLLNSGAYRHWMPATPVW